MSTSGVYLAVGVSEESANRFGGSTSVSGGQVWVPGNHRAAELGGGQDTMGDACMYCLLHGPGRDEVTEHKLLSGGAPPMD